MEDLISVVIPVYNVEKYLDRCLTSVTRQDYGNIEVILVDDGSTDHSAEICRRWQSEHPDIIKFIHQENNGASIARKQGIETANGLYLTFVDSDDYVTVDYVSELYKAAIKADSKMGICTHIKSDVGQCDAISNERSDFKMLTQTEFLDRLFKYEFWGMWGGIYHKSLFNDIIYPDATLNEDYFIKVQMASKVDKVGYCSTPHYVYESHPGSLSRLHLSFRALGEFDNTVATLRYASEHLPEYTKHALAIASEAACKWLGVLNNESSAEYNTHRSSILDFVRKNFTKILLNRHFLWKLKIVLCKNLIYARSKRFIK